LVLDEITRNPLPREEIMPLVPVTHQSWLFSPPLELPLQPRLENGRFDSLRRRPLADPPECNTTQIMLADDPANPTGRDVHFFNRVHQADLASAAGNCVYAAYSGRIVKVEVQPGGDTANVSIDHHPRGLGFVTNYNHITDVQFAEGDFVGTGEPIAQVSAAPDDPTLHFELWAVVDRKDPDNDPPGDSDMVPIDPTRALYAWERRPSGSSSSCSARRTVAATLSNCPSAIRRSGESTWQRTWSWRRPGRLCRRWEERVTLAGGTRLRLPNEAQFRGRGPSPRSGSSGRRAARCARA
jgi:hypothetical protein